MERPEGSHAVPGRIRRRSDDEGFHIRTIRKADRALAEIRKPETPRRDSEWTFMNITPSVITALAGVLGFAIGGFISLHQPTLSDPQQALERLVFFLLGFIIGGCLVAAFMLDLQTRKRKTRAVNPDPVSREINFEVRKRIKDDWKQLP